jgi:hypothetical protein
MKNWIFLTGLALLLFAGCKEDDDLFQQIKLGEEVTLQLDQTVEVTPDGIRMTFIGIPEDSRCPTGVECIWEGRALVKFSFRKGNEYMEDVMATPSSNSTVPAYIEVFGRKAKLLKVTPYPEGNNPIPAVDYRVRVVMVQGL